MIYTTAKSVKVGADANGITLQIEGSCFHMSSTSAKAVAACIRKAAEEYKAIVESCK